VPPRFLAALLALALGASPLPAQRGPRLALSVPAPSTATLEGPLVGGDGLLAERQLRDLLRNGFPARFHYRVELWSVGGFANNLERKTEWDVVVRYDPLDRSYRVARLLGDQVLLLGSFGDLAEAETAVELPFRAPIAATRRGQRYYYNVVLDVEILSLSDLDEVERWLRGELTPAVRGRRNPGTALTRGLRTLFVRLLGGERRHFELRSATFRAE
jgi:hypothetical protein